MNPVWLSLFFLIGFAIGAFIHRMLVLMDQSLREPHKVYLFYAVSITCGIIGWSIAFILLSKRVAS